MSDSDVQRELLREVQLLRRAYDKRSGMSFGRVFALLIVVLLILFVLAGPN